jgi:VanZ family protein
MAVIFSASTDTFSANHTSRFIVPFLRWLDPNISPDAICTVQGLVRKGAHVTEYAILAVLLWRALRKPARDNPRPWNWLVALSAFAIAAGYSMTDEFHQSFVPSRQGQLGDVCFDSAGAALGLIVLWAIGRWRKHW